MTVNNFVVLARYHYFDNTICHRAIPSFAVQCGDPTGTGTGGPGYSFADELPAAGSYKVGSIAMANSGPDTNGSQFFIITGANGVALPANYTLFGEVTDGLDTTVKALDALGNPIKPRTASRHSSRSSSSPSPSPKPDFAYQRSVSGDHVRAEALDGLLTLGSTTPGFGHGRLPWTVISPTRSHPSAVRTSAEPLGSSTMGVLANFRVRCRRSVDHVSASVTRARPSIRPSPSVKAPPRGSTIGSHIAAALPPVAATRPPLA